MREQIFSFIDQWKRNVPSKRMLYTLDWFTCKILTFKPSWSSSKGKEIETYYTSHKMLVWFDTKRNVELESEIGNHWVVTHMVFISCGSLYSPIKGEFPSNGIHFDWSKLGNLFHEGVPCDFRDVKNLEVCNELGTQFSQTNLFPTQTCDATPLDDW